MSRLLVAALLAALALPASVPGSLLYACPMDGRVRSACCCGEDRVEPASAAARLPRLVAPGCCTKVRTDGESADPRIGPSHLRAQGLVAAAVLSGDAAGLPAAAPATAVARSGAPPGETLPLLLRTGALRV